MNLLLFHLGFPTFTRGLAAKGKEKHSKTNHPAIKEVKNVSTFIRYLTYSSFQKYLKNLI